jgi:hypothetical protein
MPSTLDFVPPSGTQEIVVAQSSAKPAAAGLAKSVNVVLAGTAKSAWKWKTL